MGVAVRHHLVRFLRCRVQRQRMLGGLVLGERHQGIGAIHRAGGSKHQVLDIVMAATLDDVQKTGDVGRHVDMRILRGVAHTRLRGKVDHAPWLVRGKRRLDRRAIGQIRRYMGVVRVIHEARQPRLLQVHVVVVAEVVDADDFITALKQSHGDMRADEPRGAGYQNLHCVLIHSVHYNRSFTALIDTHPASASALTADFPSLKTPVDRLARQHVLDVVQHR